MDKDRAQGKPRDHRRRRVRRIAGDHRRPSSHRSLAPRAEKRGRIDLRLPRGKKARIILWACAQLMFYLVVGAALLTDQAYFHGVLRTVALPTFAVILLASLALWVAIDRWRRRGR